MLDSECDCILRINFGRFVLQSHRFRGGGLRDDDDDLIDGEAKQSICDGRKSRMQTIISMMSIYVYHVMDVRGQGVRGANDTPLMPLLSEKKEMSPILLYNLR